MDNYIITLIKNSGGSSDITKFCGNLSWKDNIDTLGMELNFDVARNSEDKYMKVYDVVGIGDKLILTNKDKEVFRGIIVDLGTEYFTKSISAFDYAFYLNKSKTIIQFNKVPGHEVITKLCNEFNVPIGNITSIPTLITKIYKEETISDIIKDVLEQATKATGIKYRLESREGKIYVERYTDLIISPKFKPARNIASIDVMKVIGGISKSESIADMKNSILISSNNEESSRIVATAKDDENIAKFGLLQEVESIDDEDMGQATNIANNKLKELNRVGEDISIGPLLGDDDVRSGRILEIENEMFGLSGQYLVKDCTHNYHNRIHTMDITVEKVI